MTEPNPLLESWTEFDGLPPFDRIRPEHFPAAIAQGMEAQNAEIDAIAEHPEPANFANTIEALERCGKTLKRVVGVFYNLAASLGGPALERLDTEFSPKLARHWVEIAHNPAIYQRVAAVFAQADSLGLAEDQQRLLQRTHLNLVRAGAGLSVAAKSRMAEISERMAMLQTQFAQNVLFEDRDSVMA
jgi:peptidyl-dipeptidase Dcp